MYPILRVAVIGGSGFVGSYVAEKLSEASFETTIATRNPEHTRREPLLVLPKVLLATGMYMTTPRSKAWWARTTR